MWVLPYLAIALGVIALDQLSKVLVCALLYGEQVAIIPGILRFSYVENTGMAFGMLSDHRWIFMVLSVIGIAAVGVYLWFYVKTKIGRTALALIIGGGIGNMIDRTVLGYVVDMIDFRLINFAVFNVADSFVCVGAGLMILYLILEMVKEAKAEKASRSEGEHEEGMDVEDSVEDAASVEEVEMSVPETDDKGDGDHE
jgi:signal peptidase II